MPDSGNGAEPYISGMTFPCRGEEPFFHVVMWNPILARGDRVAPLMMPFVKLSGDVRTQSNRMHGNSWTRTSRLKVVVVGPPYGLPGKPRELGENALSVGN